MVEDMQGHEENKTNEKEGKSSGIAHKLKMLLVSGVCLAAVGCASVTPQMNPDAKDLNLIEAKVFPNKKTEEEYRKATDASSSVNQITGKPKVGLGDQHKINWGRSVGGSLFGGFVDPATPFKITYKEGKSNPQALRADSPGQVFWVSANENGAEILTSHVSPPDAEKFSKTSITTDRSGSSSSNTSSYSSILEPGKKTFINPRQIPQIQNAIKKHNAARQGYIENVEQDGSVPGGFRASVDAKGTQEQPLNLSAQEQKIRDLELQLKARDAANTTRVEITDIRDTNSEAGVGFATYKYDNKSNMLVVQSDGKQGTADKVSLGNGKQGSIDCDTTPEQCAEDVAGKIEQNPSFIKKLLDNGPQKSSGRSSDKGFTTYR